MAQKIESEKLLIKDVFNKWFRIPEYQRPYVWGNDQINELLEDIMQAQRSNPDSEYFLGSMVLQKNEKFDDKTKYIEYDLLDGQQRLTTLFLITAVIRDLTPPENQSRLKICRESIFQMGNEDDRIPERLRVVFDIRNQVKDFINDYVKIEGGTLKKDAFIQRLADKDEDTSIRNISNAILKIHEFFEENDLNLFFPYLRSNVLMIYVSAEELEDAFRMFTIMNSRGVKLRNSDIIKADNLGQIKNDDERMGWAKKWEETETYFGEDFDAFLSHIRTILVKQKATVSLLKEFEDNIYSPKVFDRNTKTYSKALPLLKKGVETFKLIDRYRKHYELLFDTDNYYITSSFEIHNYLHLMQKGFEADYWIAPLLRFYDKFKADNLLPFIKALDNKFAHDWVLGYSPTVRIENINAITQVIDDCNLTTEILLNPALYIQGDELKKNLGENIYGKRAARYLLLKLDLLYHGHTTKLSMPSTISIEHILPQNPSIDSKWNLDFTDIERQEWTNKLGNLVLISRRKNTSQSNRDYSEKRERYFKNNIELFSNSVRIFHDFPNWSVNDLKKNHSDTLTKIIAGFNL